LFVASIAVGLEPYGFCYFLSFQRWRALRNILSSYCL